MRGKFITFEGIEGSGKSTQLALLIDYLKSTGYDVISTREPGGTAVSEKIRDILLDNSLPAMHSDTELALMFAARIEHVKRVIEPSINNGKWVVCDRFYDATYAYQGYGRDIPLDRIDTLREFSLGSLAPDKTFLLDIHLDISMDRVTQRGCKDRFEEENVNFYKKVRQGYLDIARQNTARICVIDGNQSKESIAAEIRQNLSLTV